MGMLDSNDPRDEALWGLLGRARRVEASAYFARKVLRAIEESPRLAWWQLLLRSTVPASICVAIAALAIAGIGGTRETPAVAGAEIEFEAIQNLDLLVASYESSIWLDPSSP